MVKHYWQAFVDWIYREKDLTIASLRQDISILEASEDILTRDVHSLQEKVSSLTKQLSDKKEQDALEEYWNTKRPNTNSYKHSCRYFEARKIKLDPRVLFTPNNNLMPPIHGDSTDEVAYNALSWVVRNITYTTDTKQFDTSEHWLFPFETFYTRKGDCEDGAILLANIMLNNGVPYWRIRLNAGSVKGGGHAWVTYLRESDNKWVILDWCYWPDESLEGLSWDAAENYFNIWFSWNRDHIFAADMLDREVE